jgi:putative transposase
VEVHIKTAVARQKDIFKAVLCIDSECTEIDKTVDCLNIDMSESLVKLIARQEGMDETSLGVKGKQGIVQSKQSRAAFLSDPEHQIVFHYTPKHTSWMNQIELWFSILAWKLLKRASLVSKADLKARVLAFIDYFNRTMAKPFKWTYKGKVLAA